MMLFSLVKESSNSASNRIWANQLPSIAPEITRKPMAF